MLYCFCQQGYNNPPYLGGIHEIYIPRLHIGSDLVEFGRDGKIIQELGGAWIRASQKIPYGPSIPYVVGR